MKQILKITALLLGCSILLCGCGSEQEAVSEETNNTGAVQIRLSDSGITVGGESISTDPSAAVYGANDIVYYEEGKDFTYGEGTAADEHSKAEAEAHTVVHITKPGTYEVSGQLSKGQIAVELGEDAKDDPDAVVKLVLNGADITCEVAPAIIFYEVYECAETDEEDAVKDVDTSDAGAVLVIADGTENNIHGSYVARIYESCTLNEEGTEVTDSKKLHKYDGAVYSKMSMNVSGASRSTGVLNIFAENEGLCSDIHLTINGGNINIESGNDGINTSEDNVSVFTMNGGSVNVKVTGETGEGDGIDSNGWLIVNGGTVISAANSDSMDSGIDADLGIYLNGGTVIASGNMLDRIDESAQVYTTFTCSSQKGGTVLTVKDPDGNEVMSITPTNDFTSLVLSSADLLADTEYTLWNGETQVAVSSAGGMMGGPGGRGERPEGERPEGFEPGERPEGEMPEKFDPENMPEGFEPGERPERMEPKTEDTV